MKFYIRNILTLTTVAAFLVAFQPLTLFVLIFAYIGLFMWPVAIIIASIVTGRQKDNMIDISDNKVVGFLVRVWLFCVVTVILSWMMLAAYVAISPMLR